MGDRRESTGVTMPGTRGGRAALLIGVLVEDGSVTFQAYAPDGSRITMAEQTPDQGGPRRLNGIKFEVVAVKGKRAVIKLSRSRRGLRGCLGAVNLWQTKPLHRLVGDAGTHKPVGPGGRLLGECFWRVPARCGRAWLRGHPHRAGSTWLWTGFVPVGAVCRR